MCSQPVLCYTFRVIRQTLDRQSKQHRNKSTNERKTRRFFERKTAGAQMKATFFFLLPPPPFFLSFFPFSPSQFLLEAFAYFKSLPKKIAQGQKWTICILKTQQRANGGREQERQRERERWRAGGTEGGRGGERQRERKSPSKWFEDNLKVTIMSISWLCHAHYAGLIAVFTCARTDYLLSCQAGFFFFFPFFFFSFPFYGEEAEREVRGRESREKNVHHKKASSPSFLHE